MVHGSLLEPYSEFFIQPLPSHSNPGAGLASSKLTVITANTSPLPSVNKGSDTAFDDWYNVFGFNFDALPLTHFSLDTVEAVLFVGKAVRILRRPQGAFKDQDLLPYRLGGQRLRILRLAAVQSRCQAVVTFCRVACQFSTAAFRHARSSHVSTGSSHSFLGHLVPY